MIVVWWIISLTLQSRVLPTPLSVFYFAMNNFQNGNAVFHIYMTMTRILIGFFASLGIGLSLGIVMGLRRVWENYFGTWVMVAMAFPDILWPILAIIWLGMNEAVAFLSITMIVFPLVTLDIWEGVKAVDKSLVDMARTFRVSRLHIIRKVYIPMLMPHILGSTRHAFAVCWKIVIIAEMFGLSNGIGYMLMYWYKQFIIGQVLAWTITFVVIMIFVERFAFSEISKRAFKWRPEIKL